MARIEIVESLFEEIETTFKKDSKKIFDLIETLEDNPKKGKIVGNVGGLVIKELKYEVFRFYFIADGYKLKVFDKKELTELLLRFIRMSNKKTQQKTIEEIKEILIRIGPEGFS